MTANDDLTQQHDIVTTKNPQPTIDDQDEDQIDGGEINQDVDAIEEQATGDTDNLPLGKKIDGDEVSRVKDLQEE